MISVKSFSNVAGTDNTLTVNTTAGSNIITVPIGDMKDFLVGHGLYIYEGNGTNNHFIGKINSINPTAKTITTDIPVGRTLSGATLRHEDSRALNKAFATIRSISGNTSVELPEGTYNCATPLEGFDNLVIIGQTVQKQYSEQDNALDTYTNISNIRGLGGTVALKNTDYIRFHFKHLIFSGFKLFVEHTSPRAAIIEFCSFHDMLITDSYNNDGQQYHNFKFLYNSFMTYQTGNYPTSTTFKGTLIDFQFIGNTFGAGTAMDTVGMAATLIAHNRFEWIDRGAAIILNKARLVDIHSNYFDRISGAAIQIGWKCRDIDIQLNRFNRCGTLKNSNGTSNNSVSAKHSCFIQFTNTMWGTINIQNNSFKKDYIQDTNSGDMSPNHLLSKIVGDPNHANPNEPAKIVFKNNTGQDQFVESILYAEDDNYSMIQIETDREFDQLDESVVTLSTVSTLPEVRTYNYGNVSVSSIPKKLVVLKNEGNITLTGLQEGIVYGGQVDDRPRYTKPEIIYELNTLTTANGSSAYARNVYSIPVTAAMKGMPLDINMVYKVEGNPIIGVVEATDPSYNVIKALKPLDATITSYAYYKDTFIIPKDYAYTSIKICFYASKETANYAVLKTDAFNASYAGVMSRAFVDKMF